MNRQLVAVLVAGAALAASFPRLDAHLLCWVALAPLVLATRDASPLRAWWLGIAFGVVLRAGTLYWVTHAMTRFGGLSMPLAIVAAGGLVLYLSIFQGAFAVAARRLSLRRLETPFLLAAIWVGLELVQSRLFTGLPWMLLGYAGGRSDVMAQAVDLFGVFGLGFVVVAANGALAAVMADPRRGRQVAALPAVLVLLTAAYGAARLTQAPDTTSDPTSATSVGVALVQGNVPQDLKWDARVQQETLERHLRLSAAAAPGTDLIVWPESSWPDAYGMERDASASRLLRGLAADQQASVLVGTVHVYEEPDGRLEVANAAVLVDHEGEWRGRYEKEHLVPFGEYLPLRRWLRFLGPLVQAVGSLRPGDAEQPLLAAVDQGVPPFGISICYEVIFPWIARAQVREGAQFLATLTNDAWYGTTAGPYQHFAMARMRAIENRRWLVRAANTGISGVFDPWGRVRHRSELETEATVSARLEPRTGLTVYARLGDAFAWACALMAGLAVAGAVVPRLGRHLPWDGNDSAA